MGDGASDVDEVGGAEGEAERRERLRQTFDEAADRYHEARTRYPTALYDKLAMDTGLGPASAVLELGPATGIATEPLAERAGSVVGVELGEHLAAAARRILAHRSDVDIVHASFDSWVPPSGWGAHDLVAAASCWHWMDAASKYERAHRHLRSGGYLAFWSASHVFPLDGDPFFAEIQDVYDRIGEGLDGGWHPTRPGEIPDRRDEIDASGWFETVSVTQYDWEHTYDAEGYIGVLDTFSGHIAMSAWQRDELYGEIRRRLGRRVDGLVRRHYGAVLHIARRLDIAASDG